VLVRTLAVALTVAGVFWVGRETRYGGLHSLFEHWWCPLPLVAIVVGAGLVLVPMLWRRAEGT